MQYVNCVDSVTRQPATDFENTLTALGNFDGVHSAHRKILQFTAEKARETGLTPAVWFFDPPASQSDKGHRLLTTLDEKLKLIADCNIRICFISNFTTLADMPGERFISDVLKSECKALGTVSGYNFRFGKGALGNNQTLTREFGKNAFILYRISGDGGAVNSTRIRELLQAGEIEKANALLGCNYAITSEITTGKRLGAKLGFPTANQQIPQDKVIPAPGVYATVCTLDGIDYRAVTDVGVRPTAENNGEIRLESHIIGFSGDIYGKTVTTRFIEKLRDEIFFNSLDELQAQIKKDLTSVSERKI